MDGGVEVGDGDGVFEDLFGEVIGDAVGAAVIEAAAGEEEAEGGALVTAASTGVELGGAAELGAEGDEGFVEQTVGFEVGDEGGEGVVEVFDEEVLFFLAVVVGVPAGAVDEAEVVGDLNKTDAVLDEAAGEEAALAELGAVVVAERGGFFLEVEVAHELGAGEAEGFALGGFVVGHGGGFSDALLQGAEEFFPGGDALAGDVLGAGEAGGAGSGVGEVDVAMFSAEEAGAAAGAGVANEHVGGHFGVHGAALMGDDGADGGVAGAAADGACGVDEVGGDGVFVDDVVVHRADGGDLLHEAGGLGEVLGEADAGDGGFDGGVGGAGFFGGGFGVAERFGVEGIDLGHATAEPDEDAVFGFAFGFGDGGGAVEEGGGGGGEGGGLEEVAAVHGDFGLRIADCGGVRCWGCGSSSSRGGVCRGRRR